MEGSWTPNTNELLRKWKDDCKKRKKAHYKTANVYGWKHKILAIPVIIISSVLGSLSFMHPSFQDPSCHPARRALSVTDPYNGNCAAIEQCVSECPDIVGIGDPSGQTLGYWDCECCYNYWAGCSWGECSNYHGSKRSC